MTKVVEVPHRHVLPQAGTIFKTKLTATSSSWNIPDLITDTGEGSFKQVGFSNFVLFGKSYFLHSYLFGRQLGRQF